jgi:hypothetical protein
MINAFAPCLLLSLRRRDGSVMPFFQIVQGRQIYAFSVNFLRFAWFFERGAFYKIITFSYLLRGFAPSREINQVSRRAQGCKGFTRRREGKNTTRI